ncbi:CYTH domain-containing protein [Candidatus Saccharibacteria bacterium]|nr:CYTH domain-containing protein [Candidatus Saccharibacteria bacterium]
MKKVIVKCKLRNREEFETRLAEVDMRFERTYWQHDRVYYPRSYKKGQNYPRLIMRTEMAAVDRPARYYLVLKRHIEDSGIDIVNQTVVKDYSEASLMIHQLGFVKYAETSRRRMKIVMGPGVIIYLDKLENIPGYYAKMEAMLEEGENVREVREDLVKTFKVLGQTNIVNESYAEIQKH